MKVLLVANGYPPTAFGGVEVYTSQLATALQSKGHAVSVIAVENDPGAADYTVSEESSGGVTLFRLVNTYKNIQSFADIFTDPHIDELFARLLDTRQPDLVHFNHLIALSARLPIIATERGIPSLFTAHDFWSLCHRIYLQNAQNRACPGPVCGGQCYPCLTPSTPVKHARDWTISTIRNKIPFQVRGLLRRLFIKDDHFLPNLLATAEVLDLRYHLFRDALQGTGRIVVPSQYVKQAFVNNGYGEEMFEVLPLGMADSAADARSKVRAGQPLRFGFVGAILPLKGAEVLVRAFMATPGADIRLTFHGREEIVPAFSASLRHLAAHDDRIRFAGPFQPEDRDRIYEDIDVLVIPSIAHESFSLVAREALLRGIPVVASDVGALPEVIVDGVNGFLTAPGDTEALTANLTRLADHPELLSELQLPGPVSILSIEQHTERLLAIYEECRALPS